MPMRLARVCGEGRRAAENIRPGLRKAAVKTGKPKIITDRMPDSPKIRVMHHGQMPRLHRVTLAIDLVVVKGDIEQMDPVLATGDLALI